MDSGKQKLAEGEADDPPRLLSEKGMSPLRISGEFFEPQWEATAVMFGSW